LEFIVTYTLLISMGNISSMIDNRRCKVSHEQSFMDLSLEHNLSQWICPSSFKFVSILSSATPCWDPQISKDPLWWMMDNDVNEKRIDGELIQGHSSPPRV
jgi:hypothetical protein